MVNQQKNNSKLTAINVKTIISVKHLSTSKIIICAKYQFTSINKNNHATKTPR